MPAKPCPAQGPTHAIADRGREGGRRGRRRRRQLWIFKDNWTAADAADAAAAADGGGSVVLHARARALAQSQFVIPAQLGSYHHPEAAAASAAAVAVARASELVATPLA